MKISGSQFRWGLLTVIAIVLLLLRLYRQEWLKGKNPLLFVIIFAGLYMIYSLAKNKL